jgi:DNA-binding CsgD family transcriptional regulator
MAGRERDELTEREREVLALIRVGLTNEEIAGRLGITLDGAKYHVSQILSKLGVATREEAAALAEAGKPRLREGGRRRWWAALPLAAKAAGAALVVAAVAGLGVLAWGVLATNPAVTDDSFLAEDTTQTVPWLDVTPGPTPSPSPFPTPRTEDLSLRACQPTELVAAVYESEGGNSGITRYVMFRNVSTSRCTLRGSPQVEVLDAQNVDIVAGVESCQVTPGCGPNELVVLLPGKWDGTIVRPQPQPGDAAIAIKWPKGQEPFACEGMESYLRIHPHGEESALMVAVETIPPCVAPSVGHFFAFRDFSAPPSTLSVELISASTAVSGTKWAFGVRITNVSTSDVPLSEPCPNYELVVGAKDVFQQHMLNCSETAKLAVGQSVVFSIETMIPNSLSPGAYPVTWGLNYPAGTSDSATIQIVSP